MLRQKENYNLYLPLTVANVCLQKSSCVKYLGVYIDCHLNWHDTFISNQGVLRSPSVIERIFFGIVTAVPQPVRDKPTKKRLKGALLHLHPAPY